MFYVSNWYQLWVGLGYTAAFDFVIAVYRDEDIARTMWSDAFSEVRNAFRPETLLELQDAFKACPDRIACIIIEPLMGNLASTMPKDGYLQFVRKICDEYGIVLIMDEVKTGFRIAKGGAQEYFNIQADLVTRARRPLGRRGHGIPGRAVLAAPDVVEVGAEDPHVSPHGVDRLGPGPAVE